MGTLTLKNNSNRNAATIINIKSSQLKVFNDFKSSNVSMTTPNKNACRNVLIIDDFGLTAEASF